MRKLVLKMSMTVDGFVGGPRGELDWLFPSLDPEAVAWAVELVSQAGVHAMGSRTFKDMASYWPTSEEPFAPPMNEIPKVVFSRRGLDTATTTRGLEDAPRVRQAPAAPAKVQSWNDARVLSGDLAEEVAALKKEPGEPIFAHGGASFARSLIERGLVDEYWLLTHPVAIACFGRS